MHGSRLGEDMGTTGFVGLRGSLAHGIVGRTARMIGDPVPSLGAFIAKKKRG